MEIKKKLLDIVRDKIRFKHYSLSTEWTYISNRVKSKPFPLLLPNEKEISEQTKY